MNSAINDPPRDAAYCAIFCILGSTSALTVFLLLPLVLNSFSVEFRYSNFQLGLLGSADLLGVAIASLSALHWKKRWPWRQVSISAIVSIVLINLITPLFKQFELLLLLRLTAGFAGGIIMAVGMAYIGRTHNANKMVAGIVVMQVSFTVVGFEVMPMIIQHFTPNSIFIVAAALNGLLFPFARKLPNESFPATETRPDSPLTWPVVVTLAAIAIYFMAQAGIWGFVEVWGQAAGIGAREISRVLALATLISLAGPAYAFLFDQRFGRLLPLGLALLMQGVSLLLLTLASGDLRVFFLALVLFEIGWNLGISYQVTVLVDADPKHLFIVLYPSTVAFGYALGPTLMGASVTGLGLQAFPLTGGLLLLWYSLLLGGVLRHLLIIQR